MMVLVFMCLEISSQYYNASIMSIMSVVSIAEII